MNFFRVAMVGWVERSEPHPTAFQSRKRCVPVLAIGRRDGIITHIMKCPFCNQPNPDDARDCRNCGARLDRRNEPTPADSDASADRPDAAGDSELSDLERDLLDLLRAGRKIPAIKLCRQETGLGLKEAKDTVEALARKHQIEAPGGSGCAGVLLVCLMAATGFCTLLV